MALNATILLYPSDTRGTFGDAFGASGALFSGLAFIAFVFALYMQRKELGLQRQELQLQRQDLELSRKELKASAEALGAQVKVMSISARLQILPAMIHEDSECLEHLAKNPFCRLPLSGHAAPFAAFPILQLIQLRKRTDALIGEETDDRKRVLLAQGAGTLDRLIEHRSLQERLFRQLEALSADEATDDDTPEHSG